MIIVCRLLQAYMIVLFARIIMSWFPIEPNSGMSSVYGFLHTLTEPVLGPLRRVIPPIGVSGMGLDLSPLIVFFLITILLNALC